MITCAYGKRIFYVYIFEKNIHNYRQQAGTKIGDGYIPARV